MPPTRRRLAAAAGLALGLLAAASGTAGQELTRNGAIESAAEYRTDPPAGPGFLGSEAAVLGRALAAVRRSAGASLTPDRRLALLAGWVERRLGPENAVPGQDVLDALARRAGLVEPVPHLLVLDARQVPRLDEAVAARLTAAFDLRSYTHIGAVAEAEPGRVIVVMALSRRRLRMSPVPRTLAGPGRLRLEGRLIGGLSRPELTYELPSGETRSLALGQGAAFRGDVDLPAKGRYRMEIIAHGPEGPTVAANFPVFVGVPVDEVVEKEAAPGGAAAAEAEESPDEVRRRLLELIDAERQRAGLAPLTEAPDLDSVAFAHSEDMRAGGFVAHVSPTKGDLEERLRRAGIQALQAAENVGRGYGAEEIHRGFMDSPGHRAAILHEGMTDVGLGVSAGREDGRDVFLITELFVRRPTPLGPDAKALFLIELERRREAAGLARPEEDAQLSAMADKAARDFLLMPGLSRKDLMIRLQSQVYEEVKRASTVFSVFMIVGTLDEGAAQAAGELQAAKARRLGLGLAQAPIDGSGRPDLAPGSIVLVLIFAK